MAYMTDTYWQGQLINYLLAGGSWGGLWTGPNRLRLMSAMGAGNGNVNGSNGTEMTNTNLPGYGTGGASAPTMGAPAFGTYSVGTPAAVTNLNAVNWTITGTQTANVVGLEIWDSEGTPKRVLQGTLTSPISGAANGDTISFAVASISADPRQW